MEERFNMNSQVRKVVIYLIGAGLLTAILGLLFMDPHAVDHAHEAAHGAADAHAAHGHGHGGHEVSNRVWSNILLNTVWFTGISLCGMFFVALFNISMSSWQTVVRRVAEAMWPFLLVGFACTLIIAFFGNGIYHWTHDGIVDVASENYDNILAKKAWYLNLPGWILRLSIYFIGWILFSYFLRRNSLNEDKHGGSTWYKNAIRLSAGFVVFFAVSTSMWSWDSVMSLDPHWFSTLFGWYMFSSYFVSFFAVLTILVIVLKRMGHLSVVNDSHLHDLGKLMFAFSLLWMYLWFSQFLLIWYSNIPEETLYFVKRLAEFKLPLFTALILNFLCPFLILMTRNSKRNQYVLLLLAVLILIGHYLDFYQMIMPDGAAHYNGFGLFEIGTTLTFAGVFAFIVFKSLEKASLIPKNSPHLKESIHHEC